MLFDESGQKYFVRHYNDQSELVGLSDVDLMLDLRICPFGVAKWATVYALASIRNVDRNEGPLSNLFGDIPTDKSVSSIQFQSVAP